MRALIPSTVLDLCTDEDRFHSLSTADEVLRRAKLLPDEPRNLLYLVLAGRTTQRALARARNEHPGSLSRRIHRLQNRLLQPIAQQLVDRGHLLSDAFRHLAIQHFILAKSVPTLSRETGISPADLRAILHYVQGWAQGHRA